MKFPTEEAMDWMMKILALLLHFLSMGIFSARICVFWGVNLRTKGNQSSDMLQFSEVGQRSVFIPRLHDEASIYTCTMCAQSLFRVYFIM